SQIWQQIRNGVVYEDTGNTATRELVAAELEHQKEALRAEIAPETFEKHFEPAARLIADLVLGEDYVDFLTLPAYDLLEKSARDRAATK
ncbi:malate synthase A, partial [Kocuria sp. CPCC 205300]